MNFSTTREQSSLEPTEENSLTGKIIGAAIDVHRTLGPGLLESAYETCWHMSCASISMGSCYVKGYADLKFNPLLCELCGL